MSSATVGDLVRHLIPKKHLFKVLSAIGRSVQIAQQVAPLKWGLRINQDSIMLKVGMPETLQIWRNNFHFLVDRKSLVRRVEERGEVKFSRATYKSMPGCDFVDIDSSFDSAVRAYNQMIGGHTKAIAIAGRSPRRHDTKKDHSAILIDFIARELNGQIASAWLADASCFIS